MRLLHCDAGGAGVVSIGGAIPRAVEEEPETVVLSGSPSAGSDESAEPNPYAAPGQAGAYVQPLMQIPQSNDVATISMVMGIVTWVCIVLSGLCFTVCLIPFAMIAGIVTGHMGINKANEMGGEGRGMAIAGLVMNYLALLIIAGGVLFGAVLLGGAGFTLGG